MRQLLLFGRYQPASPILFDFDFFHAAVFSIIGNTVYRPEAAQLDIIGFSGFQLSGTGLERFIAGSSQCLISPVFGRSITYLISVCIGRNAGFYGQLFFGAAGHGNDRCRFRGIVLLYRCNQKVCNGFVPLYGRMRVWLEGSQVLRICIKRNICQVFLLKRRIYISQCIVRESEAKA